MQAIIQHYLHPILQLNMSAQSGINLSFLYLSLFSGMTLPLILNSV